MSTKPQIVFYIPKKCLFQGDLTNNNRDLWGYNLDILEILRLPCLTSVVSTRGVSLAQRPRMGSEGSKPPMVEQRYPNNLPMTGKRAGKLQGGKERIRKDQPTGHTGHITRDHWINGLIYGIF